MKKTILIIVTTMAMGCFGKFKTPAELADASKCDIGYISGWEGGKIQYKEQAGYAEASKVMERSWGDCKGFAVVAQETLDACGIINHIVQLSQDVGPSHVITVFTLPNGEKGFINAGQSRIYPASTSWRDIIYDVSPGRGHWQANFAEEVK